MNWVCVEAGGEYAARPCPTFLALRLMVLRRFKKQNGEEGPLNVKREQNGSTIWNQLFGRGPGRQHPTGAQREHNRGHNGSTI